VETNKSAPTMNANTPLLALNAPNSSLTVLAPFTKSIANQEISISERNPLSDLLHPKF
jgi:hypothetical protein